MNVGQIKTGVKRFGFSDDDPLIDWINEANAQFQEAAIWPWLKKQISGIMNTGDVLPTVPPTSVVPDSIWIVDSDINSIPLDFKPYTNYVTSYLTDQRSRPCYWTKFAEGDYRVSPPPDQSYNYTINYTDVAETFTADGNIPSIPTRYHYALVRGAAAIGLDAENQEERSTVQQDKFDKIIDRAIAYYRTEQRGRFGRIRNVRD